MTDPNARLFCLISFRLRRALLAIGVLALFTLASPQALGVLDQDAQQQAQEETAAEDAAPVRPGEKKVLTIDDYDRWNRIASTSISERGDWVSYAYVGRERDALLFVRHIDSEKVHEIPRGSQPRFSDDSKWVAYLLSPPQEEIKKLRKQKKPVRSQGELLNLESGEKVTWDNVASMAFAKGSSHLAVRKIKLEPSAEHDGTDMLLRNLDGGYDELIGSVSAFAFNKPGTLLAYTIDAADRDGNGIVVMNLATGARRPMDNDQKTYARLSWEREGRALAALKGDDVDGKILRANTLLTLRELEGDVPEIVEIKPGELFDFPENHVISELASITWSDDLQRVFFGIKQQEDRITFDEEDELANVDIWHWADDRLQSVQMVRANQDRNRTYVNGFNLATNRFIPMGRPGMRSVQLGQLGTWAIGVSEEKYTHDWHPRQADYHAINTLTGETEMILEAHNMTMGISPDNKHFLYWRDGQYQLYSFASGEHVHLTAGAPVDFTNVEFDRAGEKPPYGVAGWTADGNAVVLNHAHDLYLQPLDGSAAINLTGGVGDADEIRLRYVRTDPEAYFIDLSKPQLLSAYGRWTKDAGYFQLDGGEVTRLIYEPRRFGSLAKARQADRYIYTIQTFRNFPDYYASDTQFSMPKKLTDANPHQSEYKWGRRVLFDYTNNDGKRLQGTLAVPDDYEPGQRLPMLVNFYEKNSQNLHSYSAPTYRSGPQFSGYVSNGYLVMQPDIHFRVGRSHSDMLECISAAVRKVVELGYADPERIGLHGHSYSGQGAAFISTQTDMFAAIVAGAAATDLVSDFNQLWKAAGTNQHNYDIHGQGRFGTNPYDDLDLYMHESAVFNVRDVTTPLLLLHGTDDGAVEWLQGIEFYNALRFNNKSVVLLSYPGEGHGLRQYPNQKDFQVRMRQFFDHHLKGTEAPRWLTRGVPFLEKEQQKRLKHKPKDEK